MPNSETRRRPKWSTAEWLATAFSLILVLLATGVWPFVLERMFNAHLVRKAQEGRDLSQPHLSVFRADIDENGRVPTLYINYTQFLGRPDKCSPPTSP
jgi:hypothetical protein